MSMQTVRRKALRQNPYSTLGKPPLRSSRDRITRAINGTWSLRELPDNVRELLIEPRQPGGCKLKTAPVRPVVAARPAE
ncbi:hypothetical protein L3D04_26325, partial [Escherichia coli]|nr:hypothetical protein [Escherichia coli]